MHWTPSNVRQIARLALVTASAFNLPALTSGITVGILMIIACTCPAVTSVTPGAAPLYGTCSRSMRAVDLSNSTDKCDRLPLPAEAMVTLPGCSLARRAKSA